MNVTLATIVNNGDAEAVLMTILCSISVGETLDCRLGHITRVDESTFKINIDRDAATEEQEILSGDPDDAIRGLYA